MVLSEFYGAKFFRLVHPHQISLLVSYVLLTLPVVLITWAGEYIADREITYCKMESRWTQLFRLKDEATIRSIQKYLHCCGLNSLKDRAWPFPSGAVDARACERSLGFSVPCAPAWRKNLLVVASLNMTASVMLAVASVCFLLFWHFLD